MLPSREAFGLARSQAERALAIDPNESMGHLLLGHAALFVDWDWTTAERHYQRARDESKRVPGLWSSTAGMFLLISMGRFEEARERLQSQRIADPLSPSVADMLAHVELMARRYDAAIEICDQILAFAPSFSEAHRKKAMTLLDSGHPDRALPCIEEAVRLSHRNVWTLVNLTEIYHALGRIGDADTIIAELESRAKTEAVPPYALAVGAICGSRVSADRLFDICEESMAARDFWLVMNRVERWPAWVKADPRFEAVNQRIGIPKLAT
jgi:Flp pilus assembly protein TadD